MDFKFRGAAPGGFFENPMIFVIFGLSNLQTWLSKTWLSKIDTVDWQNPAPVPGSGPGSGPGP